MSEVVLYDYWRSSASYRVRIALNLCGVAYRAVPVNLPDRSHVAPEHLARNPQGLVPVLEIDGRQLSQSLAMIEYLAETRPECGLVPQGQADVEARARIRTLSYAIAMEIHPVCNLKVINHVMELTGGDDQVRLDWMGRYIGEGLAALEKMLEDPATGTFCHGNRPTMADCCLMPQIYNARRWQVDLSGSSRINAIVERCEAMPAFAAAHPDRVGPG